MSTNNPAESLVAILRPQRRNPDRPVTEDDEFLAMLWRQLRALEYRMIDRPENLPHVLALQARLAEIANVTISVNAARYAVNPASGASAAECGRALGITKQSASERRRRGDDIVAARVDAAGAARFTEAARERAQIQEATTQGVTSLAEYRARHQAA